MMTMLDNSLSVNDAVWRRNRPPPPMLSGFLAIQLFVLLDLSNFNMFEWLVFVSTINHVKHDTRIQGVRLTKVTDNQKSGSKKIRLHSIRFPRFFFFAFGALHCSVLVCILTDVLQSGAESHL